MQRDLAFFPSSPSSLIRIRQSFYRRLSSSDNSQRWLLSSAGIDCPFHSWEERRREENVLLSFCYWGLFQNGCCWQYYPQCDLELLTIMYNLLKLTIELWPAMIDWLVMGVWFQTMSLRLLADILLIDQRDLGALLAPDCDFSDYK